MNLLEPSPNLAKNEFNDLVKQYDLFQKKRRFKTDYIGHAKYKRLECDMRVVNVYNFQKLSFYDEKTEAFAPN